MDFEDKKENIQPLPGGRNPEHLEYAFESIERWEADRKSHEKEIENYVGDDPLQPWYTYVYWMEQTNVSSGKPMIMEDAVRRCVQTFENDPRYVQDHRFIKLCIKYIDSQPTPVELYNELYNRGVGTLCSELYIAWAYYYDAVDNFAKTEEVFQKGLGAGAEPKADLEQAHKTFGFSMSQRLLHKDECSKVKFQATLDDRRNALTSLKASRKKHVGSIRTGLAVKSYQPGVVKQGIVSRDGSAPNAHNVPTNAIVYSDEPGGSGTGNSIVRPFSSVHNDTENIVASARMAKLQGPTKKGTLFPSHHVPSFDIPLDEENCQPIPSLVENYSRGIRLPARFFRRNKPQTPFVLNICVGNPKERAVPVYDKIRLYCRTNEQRVNDGCEKTEYSPEELRAYRYFIRNGVDNRFTEEHARIWGRGYDIGIRLHPFHVRECKSTVPLDKMKNNPSFGECDLGIQTRVREMYANQTEEKSIEELLMGKWHEGKIKRCIDRRYQDDVDPVDMDETHVESQRISMGGARFSIVPSMVVDGSNRALMRQRKSIFPGLQAGGPTAVCITEETEEELRNRSAVAEQSKEKNRSQPSSVEPESKASNNEIVSRKRLSNNPLEQACTKKEDTRPTPQKSVSDHENKAINEKLPDVLPAVPQKVHVFVDDSDENDERDELKFPKPSTSSGNEQPYYPNDSCSTQMFNLFVKNISTPVGPIRKPHSEQMSATTGLTKRVVVFADDEGAEDLGSKFETQHAPQKEMPSRKVSCPTVPQSEAVDVQVPLVKVNDENAVPVVDSSTPPSTSTSTSSGCNSTQSQKQLSTIMERTETSTTSGSAVTGGTKSTVDSQPLSPERNFTNAAEDETKLVISKPAERKSIEEFFKLPLPHDEPKGFYIHVDSTETMINIPLVQKRDLPPLTTTADEKENECVLRATGATIVPILSPQSNAFESGNAAPFAGFHLPEEPTFTGIGTLAGQRNLSHMVQRDIDANSILSFRMTTERTNTVPLQLVKPKYTIPELQPTVDTPTSFCAPISSAVTSDNTSESTASASSRITSVTETERKKGSRSPKKNNCSLLELLNATFSPKVGGPSGTEITEVRDEASGDGKPKDNSFNLSNVVGTPQPKKGYVDLPDDLPVALLPCIDMSLLPVAQLKMEPSLNLDASLELPKFKTAAPMVPAANQLEKQAETNVPTVNSGAKIVLDEFPSPFPPVQDNERNSLDDINTVAFSLNINHAINSTVFRDDYKTPRKQTGGQKQWPEAAPHPFVITDVRGAVSNHASMLHSSTKDVIDLSAATEPASQKILQNATTVGRRLSPLHDDLDTDVSIYHHRTALSQDEEQWEEIDEHFDPQTNNEYQRKAVDMDCTMQHIEMHVGAEQVDPFDRQLQEAFLDRLDFMNYISEQPNCSLVNKLQPLRKGVVLEMQHAEEDSFVVQRKIGKGAYGTVYCANHVSTGKQFALKQERPANLWEYYICLEIRSRLTNSDILPGFISIDHAIVGNNASIFVSSYSRYGNILDVCNLINKVTNRNVDEFIAMIISAQLLSILDHLHSCQIIHADIKPDNFLFMSPINPSSNHPCVQLIDFGESIDMKLFQKDVTFRKVITTEGFTCVEMREQKPWTYQPDLYGLAGTSHVMLFGKYMHVQKNIVNWSIKTTMPRYFKKAVWENYFTALLNIRDCAHLPNLQNLRTAFLEEIALHEKYISSKIVEFNQVLASCK